MMLVGLIRARNEANGISAYKPNQGTSSMQAAKRHIAAIISGQCDLLNCEGVTDLSQVSGEV